MRLGRFGILISILAAGFITREADAQNADLASLFGALPRFQHATLSPDGVHLAVVQPVEAGHAIAIINLEVPNAEPRRIGVDGEVLQLQWIDNERMAVGYTSRVYSQSYISTSSVSAVPREQYRMFILSALTAGPHHEVGLNGVYSQTVEDVAPDVSGNFYISGWNYLTSSAHSIFEINSRNGASTRVHTGGEDTARWFMDGQGQVLARIDIPAFDSRDLIFVPSDNGTYRQIGSLNDGPENKGYVAGVTEEGNDLAVLSRADNGRQGLYRYSLTSGNLGEVIYSRPDSDIVDAVLDERTRRVIGVNFSRTVRFRYTISVRPFRTQKMPLRSFCRGKRSM